MRFVVIGAGAVGSAVGAELFGSGQDTVLVARGEHGETLRTKGLHVHDDDGVSVVEVPTVEHPRDLTWGNEDMALLAVKSQDTAAALRDLALVADPGTPVFCLQNGIGNERIALRRFENVYGVCVNAPIDLPMPGHVEPLAGPVIGLLDVGRFPTGLDEAAHGLVDALRDTRLLADAREEVMPYKRSKLLLNLVNAARIICRPDDPRMQEVIDHLQAEGRASLDAAGQSYLPAEHTRERRAAHLTTRTTTTVTDPLWQERTTRSWAAEADYLNGEIALLGALHGVPTPVNRALQHRARQVAAGAPLNAIAPSTLLEGQQ